MYHFLVPPAPNIRRGSPDSACAAELQRRTARVARPGHVRVRLSRSASVKSKGSRVPANPTTVGAGNGTRGRPDLPDAHEVPPHDHEVN